MPQLPTQQHPLDTGLGPATTAAEVIQGIELHGRTAVVTGGYSGIGLETARVLGEAGSRVIVPARNLAKAHEALRNVPRAEVWPMDLLDSCSIDAFATRFLTEAGALHLLVNSAGIMALPALTLDSRGYEAQFATNHLGHFQLTVRLLRALRVAGGARVVSVSSLGHRYSPVHFDDIHFEHREYDPWTAYGQSKTANILFASELDKRERSRGVRAFSLHPGSIAGTGLEKHVPQQALIDAGILDVDGTPIRDPSRNLKTVEQGAATSVFCAVSPLLDGLGGVYCENCDVATVSSFTGDTTIGDSTRIDGVLPYAIDAETASRLWTLSESLLGR